MNQVKWSDIINEPDGARSADFSWNLSYKVYIGPYNFYIYLKIFSVSKNLYLILSCNQFIYYRFILNPKAVATNHSPLSLVRFSPCGLA